MNGLTVKTVESEEEALNLLFEVSIRTCIVIPLLSLLK